jgi:hypothetical protein
MNKYVEDSPAWEVSRAMYRQFGGNKIVAALGGKVHHALQDRFCLFFSGCDKADYFWLIYHFDMDLYDLRFYKDDAWAQKPVMCYIGVCRNQIDDRFAEFTGIDLTALRVDEGNIIDDRKGKNARY